MKLRMKRQNNWYTSVFGQGSNREFGFLSITLLISSSINFKMSLKCSWFATQLFNAQPLIINNTLFAVNRMCSKKLMTTSWFNSSPLIVTTITKKLTETLNFSYENFKLKQEVFRRSTRLKNMYVPHSYSWFSII